LEDNTYGPEEIISDLEKDSEKIIFLIDKGNAILSIVNIGENK